MTERYFVEWRKDGKTKKLTKDMHVWDEEGRWSTEYVLHPGDPVYVAIADLLQGREPWVKHWNWHIFALTVAEHDAVHDAASQVVTGEGV